MIFFYLQPDSKIKKAFFLVGVGVVVGGGGGGAWGWSK